MFKAKNGCTGALAFPFWVLQNALYSSGYLPTSSWDLPPALSLSFWGHTPSSSTRSISAELHGVFRCIHPLVLPHAGSQRAGYTNKLCCTVSAQEHNKYSFSPRSVHGGIEQSGTTRLCSPWGWSSKDQAEDLTLWGMMCQPSLGKRSS